VNTARLRFTCCLVLFWTALARAQSDELALVLPNCPGHAAWQREVRALFELELQAELSAQTGRPDAALPSLSVEQACDSNADALLRFRDPSSGATHTRVLSLRDAPPELRARVLALALSELLRSHWAPAADSGAPAPASAATSVAADTSKPKEVARDLALGRVPTPRPAAPLQLTEHVRAPRAGEFALSLGPSLHVFFGNGSCLYGAELSLSWWRLSLGMLGMLGTKRDDTLGRAHYRRLHGFLSFEVARLALRDWTWAAAIRGALGGTFADSDARSSAVSSHGSDLSYDGSIETWLALRFADGWSAKLRANLGYALGPRYLADSRVLTDFSGLFLGLALDLTIAL
jgi:hypothetical protein